MRYLIATVLTLLAMPAAADIIDDARKLLDAKASLIKRWETPPRIVTVHDGRFNFTSLDAVLAELDSATGLGLAEQPNQQFDLTSKTLDPLNDVDFGLRRKDQQLEGHLVFRGGPSLKAEIFVFHVPRDWAANLMILTNSTGSLARSYMRRKGPCFFSMRSRKDGLLYVSIFIDPDTDLSFDRCLYEEMAQAMGIVRDVQDTPYFTFDNLPLDKDRQYDTALLKALYDERLKSGSPVDQAMSIFAEILEQDGIAP